MMNKHSNSDRMTRSGKVVKEKNNSVLPMTSTGENSPVTPKSRSVSESLRKGIFRIRSNDVSRSHESRERTKSNGFPTMVEDKVMTKDRASLGEKTNKMPLHISFTDSKAKLPGTKNQSAVTFKVDESVNRPQVLVPSAVQSDRLRGFKEKTDRALHWAGHDTEVNSTLSSTTGFGISTCSVSSADTSKYGISLMGRRGSSPNATGLNDFLQRNRTRANSDSNQDSVTQTDIQRCRRHSSDSRTPLPLSIFPSEVQASITTEQIMPQSSSNRRMSHNTVLELPDTILENTEMTFEELVNRPQVLVSGAVQSDRLRSLKEKTDRGFQWASPYPEVNRTNVSTPGTGNSTRSTVFPKSMMGRRGSSPFVTWSAALNTTTSTNSGPITTPMSLLLASGKGEASVTSPRSSQSSLQSGHAIGLNEFLHLYRSTAYSDPHEDFVTTANRYNRRRHSSDSRTPLPLSILSPGVHRVNALEQSNCKRRMSHSTDLELPDTILENTEMKPDGSRTSSPGSSASLSPTSCATRKSFGKQLTPTSGDQGRARLKRLNRRFSETAVPVLREVSNLHSISLKTKQEGPRHGATSNNSLQRTDFPISHESLGIDLPQLSRHHLIIWRNKESSQIVQLPVTEDYIDSLEEIFADENLMFAELLKMYRCYELIPNSATIAVFDSELKAKSAFLAMILDDINAAPIWDSSAHQFIGMLTTTDFIRMLQQYRKSPEDFHRLRDEITLSTWKGQKSQTEHENEEELISIDPDDSLYDAIWTLNEHKIRHLPVIDSVTNDPLFILNYKRLLQFICILGYNLHRPSLMYRSIWDLKVGTFNKIISVSQATLVCEAMNLLMEHRVSSLPVVDTEGRVVNAFSKEDIMWLIANESYENLNITVGEILSSERLTFEGVYLCRRTDSLQHIIDWMVKTNIQRLIVVDEEMKLNGIVSLYDVIRLLVLHPPRNNATEEDLGSHGILLQHQDTEHTKF